MTGVQDFFLPLVVWLFVHPATNENPMVAILRQVQIELSNIGVELTRERRREGKAAIIQAVSYGVRVGQRILLEDVHNSRVRPRPERTGAANEARFRAAVRVHAGQL